MAQTLNNHHYKQNYARYQHYYRQIWRFYQKPVAKVSTALLLTIFTTVFFAVFAIRPTLVTIAELLRTIEDQEEVLQEMKKKSATLASAQTIYLANQDNINLLSEAIPVDKNVQELANLIEATAADHQLALNSFSVSDFQYPDSEDRADGPITMDFALSTQTDFATVDAFVADIIRLPRFVRLNSLNLSAPDEDDVGQDLNLTLNFETYYQPTQISLE